MESLADEDALAGSDEQDPASMERLMKRMGNKMGEDFGDDMMQAIDSTGDNQDDVGESDGL